MGINKHIFISLIILFSALSPAAAFQQSRCVSLFRLQTAPPSLDFAQTSDILAALDSDKNRLFSSPRNLSAFTLIAEIIQKQKLQLERLRALTFTEITPEVAEIYLSLIEKAIYDNESEFRKFQTEQPLDRISVKKVGQAEYGTELAVVRDHISSFAIATNTIIAELLTAIHYRNVLQTEKTVPQMLGSYWSKAREALLRRTDPPMEPYFETKRMDLKVMQSGVTYFLEVKYLGTRQEYSKASGKHVLQKLENMKFAADQIPGPTKVALVLVGPGRLSRMALSSYYDLGIEVVHLSAD